MQTDDFTVFQWRHSLAIYFPERDVYSWFLNGGESEGIFEVDRWDRFGNIRYVSGVLHVDVHPGLAEPETVRIEIDQLIP